MTLITHFSTAVFLDSMVILEGHAFDKLPWHEIDNWGPILVIVVPQVLKEIDNRKRDGRVGIRARNFNRLLDAAVETAKPVKILSGEPAVYLSVAICGKIDWEALSDLDSGEADARIIAEVLATTNAPADRTVFWSNDLNPRAMARRHGLEAPRMPDHWMLGPEPSPQEKEMKKLSARIKELEASFPELNLSLSFTSNQNLTIYRVEDLSTDQKASYIAATLAMNPCSPQTKRTSFDYDHTLLERYNTYSEMVVPSYVAALSKRVERLYSQVGFELKIENVGSIQAENLKIQLRASGGTIHDKMYFPFIFPPSAPEPKSRFEHLRLFPHLSPNLHIPTIGRHDINYLEEPAHNSDISFTCVDFRQGQSWSFLGIATIDSGISSPFNIEIIATASNLRGTLQQRASLAFEVKSVELENLLNVFRREYAVTYPLQAQIEAMSDDELREFSEFEEIEKE